MKVIFTWKHLFIMNGTTHIAQYPASCNVRTELNGKRAKDEVIYTVNKKPKPYYPRQFPSGIFQITDIEYTDDTTYAPVKIKTDAVREVFTWDLDTKGEYWKPTGETQADAAYWLHYTAYKTTLGCIRIDSIHHALSFAHILEPVLEQGDNIFLEVL